MNKVKQVAGLITLHDWGFVDEELNKLLGYAVTKVITQAFADNEMFIDFNQKGSISVTLPLGEMKNEPRWEITIEDMIENYIASKQDTKKLIDIFLKALARLRKEP